MRKVLLILLNHFTQLTLEFKEITNTVLKTIISSPSLPIDTHRTCKHDLTASVKA